MKKNKILFSILINVVMFMLIFSIKSYASTPNVNLTGKTSVYPNEVEEIIVKISSDDSIGVIEGKLSADSNIEITEFSVIDSKWTLTHNKRTGFFNALYAYGAKNEDVLKIKYKLKNGAKEGTIKLSNISLTTIEYNTIEISEALIKVTAKEQPQTENTSDNKDNTASTIDKSNKENKNNTNITDDKKTNVDETKNNSSKNNDSNKSTNKTQNETTVKEEKEQNSENADSRKANTIIPQLGQNRSIIIIISIIGIVGLVFIKKYKKLKQIK